MCTPVEEWTTTDLESYLADVKEVHIPGSLFSDYSREIELVENTLKARAEAGTYATV